MLLFKKMAIVSFPIECSLLGVQVLCALRIRQRYAGMGAAFDVHSDLECEPLDVFQAGERQSESQPHHFIG